MGPINVQIQPGRDVTGERGRSAEGTPADTPVARAADAQKDFIFLVGTARSGTTVTSRILGAHHDVVFVPERFRGLWRNRSITPGHFNSERYFDLREDEVRTEQFPLLSKALDDVREKFGTARVIGDKTPVNKGVFEFISSTFPGATILLLVRDPFSVARSFQARFDNPASPFEADGRLALSRWNIGISEALNAVESGQKIVVVSYEKAFSSIRSIRTIYKALGLDPKTFDRRQIDFEFEMKERVSRTVYQPYSDLAAHVAQNANFTEYRKLVNRHCLFRKESGPLETDEMISSAAQ